MRATRRRWSPRCSRCSARTRTTRSAMGMWISSEGRGSRTEDRGPRTEGRTRRSEAGHRDQALRKGRVHSCVMRLIARSTVLLVAGVLTAGVSSKQPVAPAPERPFGTLREQAATQQDWLRKRLDTFLPALMRKHGIDLWVVPMREYNEDPIFTAVTAPETFAARRRTIYVFFDKCAAAGTAPSADCLQKIALGGTSQGN